MDFDTFPAQWEWVALILGAVAFLMAVQPFAQFIWGRPRISVRFRAYDFDASRILTCDLVNLPVSNRFLKHILRVHRMTAEDVFAEFDVENIHTRSTIANRVIPLITTARDEENPAISLPSSLAPAQITVVRALKNGETYLQKGKDRVRLTPGKYRVTITIHCSEIEFTEHNDLSVGNNPHELYWEDTSS